MCCHFFFFYNWILNAGYYEESPGYSSKETEHPNAKTFSTSRIPLLSANFGKFSLSQLENSCYTCFKCSTLQNTEFQWLELAQRPFQVCQYLRTQPVPGRRAPGAMGDKEADGWSIRPSGFNISPIYAD